MENLLGKMLMETSILSGVSRPLSIVSLLYMNLIFAILYTGIDTISILRSREVRNLCEF